MACQLQCFGKSLTITHQIHGKEDFLVACNEKTPMSGSLPSSLILPPNSPSIWVSARRSGVPGSRVRSQSFPPAVLLKAVPLLPLSALSLSSLLCYSCSAAVDVPHAALSKTRLSGGDPSISLVIFPPLFCFFRHPLPVLLPTSPSPPACPSPDRLDKCEGGKVLGQTKEKLRKSLIQHLIAHMTVLCSAVSW